MNRYVRLACIAAVLGLALAAFRQTATSAAPAAAPDGKAIFAAKCAACHQASGAGGGPYPPLAGNPDVTSADTANLVNTLLNGRTGPIVVLGKTYSGSMPAWKGTLSNAEIAAVLTYVRSAWGNAAAAVSADQIAAAAAPGGSSGAAIFAAKCATCHQANGQGTAAYPPLAGNPHVAAADASGMIATIVNGKSGALVVNGKTYSGTMPTWKGQLSNADIAAVATYVRSAWGNAAPGVTEQQVAAAGPAVASAVGSSIYQAKCSSCHGSSGQGQSGVFPALAHNKVVMAADPGAMIATIEHGRSMMPSWKGQLSPGDIAAVVTYVRGAWGNGAAPVTESDVAAVK